MAQNVYECLFLLDSNRYARDPNGVAGTIPSIIESAGGEILASRLWNEQRLAYPIKGQRKGTYWLTYFRLDSSKLTELNRSCQLNEAILRNLVLKVEPRLVDVLVAHALGKRKTDTGEVNAEAEGESKEARDRESRETRESRRSERDVAPA